MGTAWSQESTGCVHFILTGNTAKVVGRVCQGLTGPAPQILSLTCLILWCMLFLQLPFSQVEGAEARPGSHRIVVPQILP